MSNIKIGVIADTHGMVRPEAIQLLRGAELIIHAGDIGSPRVLEALEAVCPTRAIRGNVDEDAWAKDLPERALITVLDRRIYVIHNLKDLDIDPVASRFDVVIAGHSHAPRCEKIDEVLYLNPGSAGPRRFKLPIAVAMLSVSHAAISASIHLL